MPFNRAFADPIVILGAASKHSENDYGSPRIQSKSNSQVIVYFDEFDACKNFQN